MSSIYLYTTTILLSDMELNEFSVGKLIIGILVLLIGLILRFPQILESVPPKYKLLGIAFTQSQYAVVNVISYVLISLSIAFLIVLLIAKFKK
jgi:hypothetical protein